MYFIIYNNFANNSYSDKEMKEIEYIRYKISKERQKEFELAYERAEKALNTSSHCLDYDILIVLKNPNTISFGLSGTR